MPGHHLPRADCWHLFPAPCSVTSCWQYEIAPESTVAPQQVAALQMSPSTPQSVACWPFTAQHCAQHPCQSSGGSCCGTGMSKTHVFSRLLPSYSSLDILSKVPFNHYCFQFKWIFEGDENKGTAAKYRQTITVDVFIIFHNNKHKWCLFSLMWVLMELLSWAEQISFHLSPSWQDVSSSGSPILRGHDSVRVPPMQKFWDSDLEAKAWSWQWRWERECVRKQERTPRRGNCKFKSSKVEKRAGDPVMY